MKSNHRNNPYTFFLSPFLSQTPYPNPLRHSISTTKTPLHPTPANLPLSPTTIISPKSLLRKLHRATLPKVLPIFATPHQARYYFGDLPSLLDRITRATITFLVLLLFGGIFGAVLRRLLCVLCLVYPIAWPWFLACRRNAGLRSIGYSAYVKGRIVGVEDFFPTPSSKRGDNTANSIRVKVEVENGKRIMKLGLFIPKDEKIMGLVGQNVEFLVFAKDRRFEVVKGYSDLLIRDKKVFVGNYPFLRKRFFVEMGKFV